MSNQQRKKNPSAFLRNIFHILQNPDLDQIIEWAPNGNGFVIKNLPLFQTNILPQYFKHKKYSSFVRQLNMYGFHKQRNSNFQNCFLHDQFKRGEEIPNEIKRKPEKKKKTNESMDNLSKSDGQGWLAIGQQLRQLFPQIADNILVKPEKQIQKNILLTSFRKCSIEDQKQVLKQNCAKEECEMSAEQQEYVSKISLKGLVWQQNQNPQTNKPQLQQEFCNKPFSSRSQVSNDNEFQSSNEIQQQLQSQQSQGIKSNKSQVIQSDRKMNKHMNIPSINILKLLERKFETSLEKLPLIISNNTLQSLSGISQILIRQNQILRKTHPTIRNMVLKSQQNKIQFLNEQIKEIDEIHSLVETKSEKNKLQTILEKQKDGLVQLSNLLQKQIQNLTQFTLNQEYMPISTTSIRFGLQRTQ